VFIGLLDYQKFNKPVFLFLIMDNSETISVKGIKKDLYEKIKEIARETGKTIGEITNESYKMFVTSANTVKEAGEQFIHGIKETNVLFISNIENLEITGEEIKNYGKKISFRNIKNLKITDISENDFENYIDSLINIQKLTIPKNINKLKVLERSKFINEIIQN